MIVNMWCLKQFHNDNVNMTKYTHMYEHTKSHDEHITVKRYNIYEYGLLMTDQ